MLFDPKNLLRARLILHVCLVTLITSQVCYVNSRFSAYSRAMGRNFVNLMFPEGYEEDMGPYVSKFQVSGPALSRPFVRLLAFLHLPFPIHSVLHLHGRQCGVRRTETCDGIREAPWCISE